jgi:hypothetical protein
MPAWVIVKSGAISPPSGYEYDAAYFVRLVRGRSTREVVVEFAAPSTVASFLYAEEVTRRFLQEDEPPEHLVVEAAGLVTAPGPTPTRPEMRKALR